MHTVCLSAPDLRCKTHKQHAQKRPVTVYRPLYCVWQSLKAIPNNSKWWRPSRHWACWRNWGCCPLCSSPNVRRFGRLWNRLRYRGLIGSIPSFGQGSPRLTAIVWTSPNLVLADAPSVWRFRPCGCCCPLRPNSIVRWRRCGLWHRESARVFCG